MNREIKNQYIPDDVSPPGETLLDVIESKEMTQSDLAIRTGKTKKHINEIIKGKAPISYEMALQLERVLDIPASFWNTRELHYQESLAKIHENKDLGKDLEWLDKFPLNAMIKAGWIKRFKDRVEQSKELLKFFGIASFSRWEPSQQADFRKYPVFQSDPGAIAAWLRKGFLDAQNIHCDPYNSSKFRQTLQKIRLLTTALPEVFQPEMVKLCTEVGVAVVFVPELPKIRISGATWWISPTKAVIQLSLRYKTDDHFWFTFFHEAGHILLHGKNDAFLEGEEFCENKKEEEANKFATNILIPETEFKRFIAANKLIRNKLISKAAILQFASKIGISPEIIVGRLQHEKLLPHTHCNNLKRSFCWK